MNEIIVKITYDSDSIIDPVMMREAVILQALRDRYNDDLSNINVTELPPLPERDKLEDAAKEFLKKTNINNTDEIVSKALADFALSYSYCNNQDKEKWDETEVENVIAKAYDKWLNSNIKEPVLNLLAKAITNRFSLPKNKWVKGNEPKENGDYFICTMRGSVYVDYYMDDSADWERTTKGTILYYAPITLLSPPEKI